MVILVAKVVHDGGLLMLIPFLLSKHKTWKNTVRYLYFFALKNKDGYLGLPFIYHSAS